MSKKYLSLAFFILALLAFLAAGVLERRHAYLTRGIPPGLPPPIANSGPAVGINLLPRSGDAGQLADTLAAIAGTGIQTVKYPFYYTEEFSWQEADAVLTAAEAQGVQIVPLLDGDPARQFAPPADLNAFAAWAGEFATRYGDQVSAYIIWDEPNLSSHWGGQPVNADEYAALLSAASAAIRRADTTAAIVAAPLAPTAETGPENLSDDRFLQEIYDAGAAEAFDAAAGKPYGFDTGPDDRRVDRQVLNFSRAILLREVMARNSDGGKALWAGNWGWNSLPDGWTGEPSIWGQTSAAQQAQWTISAVERARREWPWMGLMFLENWGGAADPGDPRQGFSIAGRETAAALAEYLASLDPGIAYPGFYLARAEDPAQHYAGGWRFSPDFGADISQTAEGEPPDQVTFDFWGTDVGLRVRRANFRARLYITVDGQPANALPQDENGAALVLTAADPQEDIIRIEPVATNLLPGAHKMTVTASRGWDQWALNGFSVAYMPFRSQWPALLLILALASLALAVLIGRRASWGSPLTVLGDRFHRLNDRGQLLLTGAVAALAALTGWLTWGEQVAGLYRRLGDGGQLALTAAAASIFYITPAFFVYVLALALLLLLIFLRPAWGLALISLVIPFYVPQLAKPVASYRFSPVEIFTLLTAAAVLLGRLLKVARRYRLDPGSFALTWPRPGRAGTAVLLFTAVATLSLLFTQRLDVATNEWRTVIFVPALFYFTFRAVDLQQKEMAVILDAWVLGGLLVALIGLAQYVTGSNLITAEAGVMRLRSVYGSPNNVALYLDRILPMLAAMLLLGSGRRRSLYGLAIIPVALALLLTFSKGGLLLGVPAGLLVVFWIWQRRSNRSPWPWAIALAFLGMLALLLASQIPQLSARLDLFGTTGVFRLQLWRASLEMIREHPVWGVGLDNFLYAYRGRYILDGAWQEPNLSHPHNIFLDFATRLGLLGVVSGAWMIWIFARTLKRATSDVPRQWLPVAAGLSGALAATLLHGLVDHSFFLVDLAFSFYLMLGMAVWLDNLSNGPKITGQS